MDNQRLTQLFRQTDLNVQYLFLRLHTNRRATVQTALSYRYYFFHPYRILYPRKNILSQPG